MPEPSLFRHYQIVQDAGGSHVELIRDQDQVAVLAFDTREQQFVHCHVLLEPLANKADFEANCLAVQAHGHPLQARLMDFGEDDGNPFYITGSVDGETLKAYLSRQVDIPGWLAALVAVRALEAVLSILDHADFLPEDVLNGMRIVQTAPQQVQLLITDYRLLPGRGRTHQALKTAFEKQAALLRDFFQDHSPQGANIPDQSLPGADFMELLTACLTAADRSLLADLQDLKAALHKLVPEQLTGEIPTAHKPRALLAPHFASYQEVARGVVNLVRIQSQRLDMSNPYSMRGTLTKTGRTVVVEQVPPSRLAGSTVRSLDERSLALSKKREFNGLIPLVLLHEGEDITCLAEETPEGVNLGDLLRDRGSLSVHEAYLVLAGLDGALDSLEKSGLEAHRLRLEDIFLLTGFPREDARTAKLVLTKLNEWPAFSLVLRGHPTLSSMVGRGLDPALLLPQGKTRLPSQWNAAWLAAAGLYLIGRQRPHENPSETPLDRERDQEAVTRLFSQEIQRQHDGKACPRGDFLAQYARLLQNRDLLKPISTPAPHPTPSPPSSSAPSAVPALSPIPEPLKTVQTKAPPPAARPPSITAGPDKKQTIQAAPLALTTGGAPQQDKPTIGFAELLFRDTAVMDTGGQTDWAKTAVDAPPTIHPNEVLLPPGGFVPLWLRAAVFLGASLILGAILAHVSGAAFWLKSPVINMDTGSSGPVSQPPSPPTPKLLEPEPGGPAAPQVIIPTLPPEDLTSPGAGLLKPPTSTLKDEL